MMERNNWLKLETIQVFLDEYKWNREQLEDWEGKHLRYKDSIIHQLYEQNKSIEVEILQLMSHVETTIHLRKFVLDGEAYDSGLDDRFHKETAEFDALSKALLNLRGDLKFVKDCLDDPLGSVQELQLRLNTAYKRNEGLDRVLKDLREQHRGLKDHTEILELSGKEKEKELARASQQINELRCQRSPLLSTKTVNSADNPTISDEGNIIGKLEKEKRDLLEQLKMVIRERDGARKDKEVMEEVFKSNENSRGKLVEEYTALCEQVAGLEAQRRSTSGGTHFGVRSLSVGSLQPSRSSMTQVPQVQAVPNFYASSKTPRTPVRHSSSSFGNRNFSPNSSAHNNIRRISSASPLSRPRQTLTRTQERVIATVQHLRDDQLEELESGGAFESVEVKVPGDGHHWVKAHWRRNRGTSVWENHEEV